MSRNPIAGSLRHHPQQIKPGKRFWPPAFDGEEDADGDTAGNEGVGG